MSTLELVKSAPFGNVTCDFYSKENEIFMTREQIGLALGYSEPSIAVGKIHSRHKERLDEHSALTKLVNTDGKQYETYIYTAKGIYEICRWSKQKTADAFFDWVYDMLEGLRKGEIQIAPTEPSKPIKNDNQKQLDIEARFLNAKTRQARLMVNMAKDFKDVLAPEAITTLLNDATSLLSGQTALPMPKIPKTFTASEIGKMAGVSANKVGRVANAHNLKTDEYGMNILDKSRHSSKQVPTFVYNEKGKDKLLELLQPDERQETLWTMD